MENEITNISLVSRKITKLKKQIKKLKKCDGSYTNTITETLEEQVEFYSRLYFKNNIPQNECINYLNEIDTVELSVNEKESLEGELTLIECENSVESMHLNKSPGCDGITVEFYKHFWNEIGRMVCESLNYSSMDRTWRTK